MNDIADIRRRIASVRQTRQITGAMQTISVAKMRKSMEACESDRAYLNTLIEMMDSILASAEEGEFDLYTAIPERGEDAVVVVSADKGLCGAFNHELFRYADGLIDENTVVYPVGLAAAEKYVKRDNTVDSFKHIASSPDINKAGELAAALLAGYGDTIKSVTLVYTRMKTKTVSEVRSVRLLPLTASGETNKGRRYEFDPSPAAVLNGLVPLYVCGYLYGALLNSAAAEHSARYAAMSASTKNADAMIEMLTLEYSRARQSAVTEQITEMIGSRRALGGKGDRV